MTWTTKKVGLESEKIGDLWVPLCADSAPSYFLDHRYPEQIHLLAKSSCRKEDGAWQVRITASIYYRPIVSPRGDEILYSPPIKEIRKIPIRVFTSSLKRTRQSVSASWLAARIVSSEEHAGPELWDASKDDHHRILFKVLLRRLLRESSRHLIIRDVMSA